MAILKTSTFFIAFYNENIINSTHIFILKMFGGSLKQYTKFLNGLYHINLVKAYIVSQNRFKTNKTQNFILQLENIPVGKKNWFVNTKSLNIIFWVEEA